MESLKIRNSIAMYLGKKFLAAIFSVLNCLLKNIVFFYCFNQYSGVPNKRGGMRIIGGGARNGSI